MAWSDLPYWSGVRPWTRSLTPIRIETRSGLTRSRYGSSSLIRSTVVNPLTAGFVRSAWRRRAIIDGQLRASSEAPVPMVYESPRARYCSGSLAFDVGECAPDFDLGPHAADHLVREVGGRGMAAQIGRPDAVGHGLQRGLVDRSGCLARLIALHIPEQRGDGQDHRHRVGDVLALQRGCGPVRRLGHGHGDGARVVEREQDGFRAGDGSEHLQDEVGQGVPVAVESRNHERLAGRGEQQRVGGVDELRVVLNVRMPLGRGVQLFLEHPLVDGADGELGSAEDLRLDPPGVGEGVVGDDAAGPAADLLGSERPLVESMPFTPLLRAVGIVDRHPDDRDGGVDAGQWTDAGDSPAGSDDHTAVDLLAQDRVGAAHVAGSFGRDRGGLDAEAELTERLRGVEHDLVARLAALLEREVEVALFDLQAEHVWLEKAQRLAEQLLAGLVAMEHGHGRCGHRSNDMARSALDRAMGYAARSAQTSVTFPLRTVTLFVSGSTLMRPVTRMIPELGPVGPMTNEWPSPMKVTVPSG